MNVSAKAVASDRRSGTFLGEPAALGYLAFTEAWERFSYYGMTGLLVLYLTQSLLLPGHVEHVHGFATLRAMLEGVFGPLGTTALASQIYGLYTGFIYFTPLLGGWIADRWLGSRNAVVLGTLLMSAGHLAMAFDASFLLALLLLIVGCGFLKGNISNQVGNLYAETDAAGRTRGFAIFSFAINTGAVTGPLACGWLAQVYGWHIGFGLAAFLMWIGLVAYLSGYPKYVASVRAGAKPRVTTPLTDAQRRIVFALILVIALTTFSLVSMLMVGPLLWRWGRQAKQGRAGSEVLKIGIGAWIASVANLLLVVGCALWHPVPIIVPVLYDVLLGIAFLYYWPTLLALVSREAPAKVRATLMGGVFVSMFAGDVALGWLGTLYERLTPLQFWALHAGIAATGGVLLLVLRRWLEAMFEAADRLRRRHSATE